MGLRRLAKPFVLRERDVDRAHSSPLGSVRGAGCNRSRKAARVRQRTGFDSSRFRNRSHANAYYCAMNAEVATSSSGTITFSKNGGSFAAFSNPLVLANGDTIEVRRTTTSAAGWVTIATS